MKDPDGRTWEIRRRISPRTPRDAEVFDWVDLFGDEPAAGRDRAPAVAVATAALLTVLVIVAPRTLARAAPVLALVLLVGVLTLGRELFGVPTVIEAWVEPEPGADLPGRHPHHIAVRARGWGAGERAERDVRAALHEGYDFRGDPGDRPGGPGA